MRTIKRKRELLPPWEMPSDPVKAVFWFTHWLVKVLVRFFWLPILGGVIYESIINGVIGGVVTFLVGLTVWGGLAVALVIFNFSAGVSQVFEEVNRIKRGVPPRRSSYFSAPEQTFAGDDLGGKIIEGTITDLDEERKKRRNGPP
ncbi:MAG: hypothetical protein H0W02_10820 [Ktedonobacteraceae bacterium]|nr:hypothetical protein [Ktedonobacteraceae bacterium]